MRGYSKLALVALAVTALCPSLAEGQRGRGQVSEGNRLYSEGRFDEAHQKYLEALLDDPESPLIRFNDGSALYRGEDFQKAMERFQEAAESGDPALQSAAWYNLGNALYRQQQLQQSLEAYKQALRANPSDGDSKHNLERVLEQLQQQEEQQQQQGEEGEQGDQDQQNQQNQSQSPDQQNQGQENQDQQEQEGQEPQGQESPQPQGQEPSQEEDSQEGQAEQQRQPGEMTPEEAERLLSAIREDPGEVNRRRAPATGKRPRKDW